MPPSHQTIVRGVSLAFLSLSAPIALSPTQAVVSNDACAQIGKCCSVPLPIFCDIKPNSFWWEDPAPCPKT
jgi:hypothetical protein